MPCWSWRGHTAASANGRIYVVGGRGATMIEQAIFVGEAARSDEDNSYLPFVGQVGLRRAVAEHVGRISGVAYDENQVLISAG